MCQGGFESEIESEHIFLEKEMKRFTQWGLSTDYRETLRQCGERNHENERNL